MTRPDRKKRRLGQLGAAFIVLLAVAAVAAPANADHRHNGGSFSFGLSLPGYYEPPPPTYYYAPPPRYYYAPPPPAYYYPPPPPRYYYDPGPSINFGLGIGTNR